MEEQATRQQTADRATEAGTLATDYVSSARSARQHLRKLVAERLLLGFELSRTNDGCRCKADIPQGLRKLPVLLHDIAELPGPLQPERP